jgi:O-antigen/teichoic acid export membrane protein
VREGTAGGENRKSVWAAPALLNAKSASIAGRYRVVGAVLRLAGSAALRDAAVLGTGALTSQLILFLAAPLFLRLYRPADYGLYSFTYGAIILLATLGTWKIERLIVVVPARATAIRLLAALTAIAVVSAILVAVLAVPLRMAENAFPRLARSSELALFWPAPLGMLILVVSAGFRNLSIRARRFRAAAAAQISRSVLFVAGTIATGLAWHGSPGSGALLMLSWQIAADGCALLIQIGANSREARLILLRPRLRRSLKVLTRHGKTVGTLAVSQVINSINQQLPISTITFAFGATFAGWFSLGSQFVAAPSSIVTLAVSDVANQRLARCHAEQRRFSHHVLRTTLGMAAVGAVPFAAIIFGAPALLPIVLGPHWAGAVGSVSILAVSAYLWFVVTPAGSVALIVDAKRYILLYHSLRLAGNVGLGAAALYGIVTYNMWLVLYVAANAFLHLLDAVTEWVFARAAETKWRAAPRF